jgi:hypothetical protein
MSTETPEVEELPVEIEQEQTPEIEAEAPAESQEPEEVVVTIGDEQPPEEPEKAPDWVRDLRKSHRELQRQNRELQAKLQTTQTPQVAPTSLPPKPKLEDHDYNSAQYEQALDAWYDRKRQVDEYQNRAKAAEQQQMQAWQAKLEGYASAKQSLRVADYEDAEAVVQDTLNTIQQGVILQGAEDPAKVVYALGKNPAKAKELAAIADPVKFSFAIAKLEAQLKVQPRKSPPPPESSVRGTAPISGAVDSNLDRLRAEAERTGDYTKVTRYRAQLREKQRRN